MNFTWDLLIGFIAGIISAIIVELIRKQLNKPKPDIQIFVKADTFTIDDKKPTYVYIELSVINTGNAATIIREVYVDGLSVDELHEHKGDLGPGRVLAPHGGKARLTSTIHDFPSGVPDTLDIELSADKAPPIRQTINVNHVRIDILNFGDESGKE